MTNFQGQKGLDREKAFWSKVDKSAQYECWPYNEYKDEDGYGQFYTENGPMRAHAYSWEVTRKCKVPEGKIVMHLCDNPGCCNPNHLVCGTHLQNMQDKVKKGRQPSPHLTALPNLYSGEIWLIRRLLEIKLLSQAKIAKMFICHQSTISHINTSSSWLCREGYYA